MSSSVHIDHKGKYIFILGNVPTQGLKNTLKAGAEYSINFTRPAIKFCLSMHYIGTSGVLFVNATKIYQFKAKDSEIKNIPCL